MFNLSRLVTPVTIPRRGITQQVTHSQDAVPLEEMYSSIDRHWQAQQAVRATEAALADRAQQHRAVQKRLLMRFKDRQPSSVAHLDLLLAETFQELLQLGAAMISVSASRDPV